MGWPFGQQVSAVEPVSSSTVETSYCTSLECVCGNDCHNNPDYHLSVTSPLSNAVDDDLFDYAIALLGGGDD
jgi:hypothetical protein